jgi:RNA recognition motif-containing protein
MHACSLGFAEYINRKFRVNGHDPIREIAAAIDPRPSRDYNTLTGAGELPVPHFKHDANSCNPCNIIIRGLSDKFDADSLRAECEKFGAVEEVQILLHPRTQQPLGTGTVKFTDTRAARAARIGLNNASRYSKKLTTYWDVDGKGAQREINEVTRENPIVTRVDDKPKSWAAPVPKMEDMEVDIDWSTPGAWMKKFENFSQQPKPQALLETPRTIPLLHPTGSVILQPAPIQATAHAAALVAAHAHRPAAIPVVTKPPPAPLVTTVKPDNKPAGKPDSPYDPNAAFDEPPSPPGANTLTQSQIVLQNQSYTVSKTVTTTTNLGDTSMIDEQMEMTPPHPSRGDYDPQYPSDPASPISAEWYYMQSTQTYGAHPPIPGYPGHPSSTSIPTAHAYAYPHMPHYGAAYPPPPPPPPTSYPGYPQPTAALTASQLARRTPQPGTFAVQISRLSVGNEALSTSLRDHFKAFNPTDVYHDHAMWYIEFRDQQSMERAARVLNNSVFQGWKINVSMYRSKLTQSEDSKRRISAYMSNKPQQARAVAIVMADLLRTALHDAQRAIIDTAIKEAIDAHRATATVPTVPREAEGTVHTGEGLLPTPAQALDISALPSFRKQTASDHIVPGADYDNEPRVPKTKKRRVVKRRDSDSEEEDVLSDVASSSSEEVVISSSDEEEEEVPKKKTKGYKRKDLEDMVPYKGLSPL